ncbi:polynucleotide 3'-phosphatase ZDP isoform X2 [Rhododendron vialii]|uniref:polynucleotide 3'-phosphatase ZDP isoform X2 n=1 Tax=Rhododendron vialii TaxID=182163 RepID=UPI00265EBADA|nr:polynucleotide 3'-phosphatase ZDP isoform X2 [Rhododendron vialii]
MQIIPNFRILLINPTLSNLFLVCQNPSFLLRLASLIMEPSKVVAEYAKSARSSCKKCDKKIDANALRLGSVTKDKRRGFDMTKWHHLDCFPMDSESVASAEDIDGFSSLKSSDQETLTKLLDESGRPGEKESKDNLVDSDAEDADADDDDDVDDTKDADEAAHVREKVDDGNNDLEDRKSKKGKLSTTAEGAELDVSFSTSDIQLKYKVVAEYAKSARSSCKKCDKKIENAALRLGSVTRDERRGFDVTKWHHLDCFPMDLESVASAEDIGGFSSLKISDQETLSKLLDESGRPGEKGAIGDKDAVKGTKERIPKRSKVREKDHDKNNDLEDRNSKKGKLSTTTEGAELDVSFSISDIQLKYKDATLLPKWKAFRTVIFLEQDEGLQDSGKIAAFDFDGCLVNTNVKKVGPDAWSLMYPSIPEKLQSLYNEGYKLVIFTNESNIDRWKNKRQVAVDSKIGRLTNFIKHVNVPMQVFIACGIGKSGGQTEDPFRKPNPGMWHLMDWHFNSGISIDMDQSFYVGDAAGRENDHSDADIKFAEAVGLKFYVPEEYFEV